MFKIDKTRGGAPPKNKNPNIIFNKITALIVTMCMVFAMVPAGLAFADSVTATFDRSSGTLTVNGDGTLTQDIVRDAVGTNTDEIKAVTSVAFSAGSNITSIGASAFYNYDGLTSIEIPRGIQTIGDNAFYGCNQLTSITIPYTVSSIGSQAFITCDALATVTFEDNSSLTVIEESVFEQCTSLQSITIPNSVTSIKTSAFEECHSLKSITIPASVTIIGPYAFSNCNTLASVTFEKGSKLEAINKNTYSSFGSCEKLVAVNDLPKTIEPDEGKDLKTTYFYDSKNVNFYYSPEIQDTRFPEAEFGTEYNGPTLAAKDSVPDTVTWSASGLPDGLTIDTSTGKISGTPTVSGTKTFTVTAENSAGLSDSKEFSIDINQKPSITTDGNLGETNYGESCSVTLEASKGYPIDAELKWTLKDGSLLPNGLTINESTGVISGTPTDGNGQTVLGTLGFTITATNGANLTDEKTFTLTVNRAPEIHETNFPAAEYGIEYNGPTLTAANSYPETITWSSSNLPDGLGLDPSTGKISGTPSVSGTKTFNVTASNGKLESSREFSITINQKPSITTDGDLGETNYGTNYNLPLQATSGFPEDPVTWALKSDSSLPNGLTLDPNTGVISGTPIDGNGKTVLGTLGFTIIVTNGANLTDEKTFSLIVNRTPEITTSEVYVSKDRKTSAQLQANAYPKVTKWNATDLPEGLTLTTDGNIKVTDPNKATAGKHTIHVTAQNRYGDADHTSDSKEITVHVTTAPQITTDKTEYDTVISTQFIVDDGKGNITNGIHLEATKGYPETVNWSISNGKLPDGLELDPETGIISGTAIQCEIFNFTVRADNEKGDYSEKIFTITVDNTWKDLFDGKVFLYDLSEDGIMGVVDIHNSFRNSGYKPAPGQFVVTLVNNDGVNGNLLDNAEFLKVYDFKFADENGVPIDNMQLSNDVAGLMPIDDELAAGWDESDLAVYYIGDNGEYQQHQTEVVEIKGKKYLKFLTNHFSRYALVDTLRDDERNSANNSNNASDDSGADSSNTGANSSSYISKSLKTGDISLKLLGLIGLAALSSGALIIINKKKKDLDDK